MKNILILLLLFYLGCGPSPQPQLQLPYADEKYIEQRFYIGAAKGKFLLTVERWEVLNEVNRELLSTIKRPYADFDQMMTDIKNWKEIY